MRKMKPETNLADANVSLEIERETVKAQHETIGMLVGEINRRDKAIRKICKKKGHVLVRKNGSVDFI